MKRRKFITAAGGLTGSLFLGPGMPAMASNNTSLKDIRNLVLRVDDDWMAIRELFLLSSDYCYLNTAGIGAVPALVINHTLSEWQRLEHNPSPGHDIQKWNELKDLCSAILGPGITRDEIALTGNATEGINIILNGLQLRKGDEIITSSHEHPALHIPLLNLHRLKSVNVRWFEPDRANGMNNVKRIESLLSRRTKLIFISHTTCTTGQVLPVEAIGELAVSNNVLFALDGAQAAGNVPLNLKKWKVDFYAFSGHKWLLGPKRTGVLYVNAVSRDTLEPVTVGAYSDDGYNLADMSLKMNPSAQRFEYGTQNEALFLGFRKAIELINTIGTGKIHEHNMNLAEQFYHELSSIRGAEILSPAEASFRSPIISFRIKGIPCQKISEHLGKRRIRVRIVTEGSLDAIRASFHLYNNENDIGKILAALREIQQ